MVRKHTQGNSSWYNVGNLRLTSVAGLSEVRCNLSVSNVRLKRYSSMNSVVFNKTGRLH